MARESSFTDYVCQHINRFDLQKTNLQVVVPSMRMGRVLTRRLSELAEEEKRLPCWLPQTITIDRLISSFSALRKGDSFELLALLYLAYTEVCAESNTETRSFEFFRDWGKMLISDFTQIDNQLAPAQEVLEYLAEEKRIGNWHLDLGSSKEQLHNRYLAFYKLLWPLYQRFSQKLLDEHIAYTGLAGRTACERLPQLIEENAIEENTFYLFAGFNALTGAEKKLIKNLVQAKKAEILWNADRYYMEDGWQEAGLFLREYQKDPDLNHFLNEEDISDKIRHVRLNVVECSQSSAQAKWAVRLLSEQKDLAGTAIVLNDESLFAPIMNALPGNIACNLTLAAPLSGTFSGELFMKIVELRHFLHAKRSKGQIPVKDLLQLLRNPVFRMLSADKKDLTSRIKAISESHRPYYPVEDLGGFFSGSSCFWAELRPLLEKAGESPAQVLQHIRQMARFCLNLKPDPGTQMTLFGEARATSPLLNDFEKAYLIYIEDCCRASAEILLRYPQLPLEEVSLRNLLSEILSGAGMNYTGHQEKGLNIMGMLETRGLSFKHAMILSLNEGILPSTRNPESFLLFSLRQHYHLPTPKEEAAMQAYHFYSLLQECPEVSLFYVNSPSDKNAEKSRFLLQLEHELPGQITKSTQADFALMDDMFRIESMQIPKTEAILRLLGSYLQKGLSFSSLHTYFLCPMQFFLRYVMGFREPEQATEELAANDKGNIFHKAMECFFEGSYPGGESLLKKPLVKEDILRLRKDITVLLDTAIEKTFKEGEFSYGANHLYYEELKIWLENYACALEQEIEQGSLTIIGCEQHLAAQFEEMVAGQTVKIKGFADRLDLYQDMDGSRLRIIDYKTGSVDGRSLDPEDWPTLQESGSEKALQLLLYIFLYRLQYPKDKRPLQACICEVKRQGMMHPLGDTLISGSGGEEKYLPMMKDFIGEAVQHMLNAEIPIACTPSEDACRYCPFIQLCPNHANQPA